MKDRAHEALQHLMAMGERLESGTRFHEPFDPNGWKA
jgi:hypothetical protein